MHVFATCIFYTQYILELDSCVCIWIICMNMNYIMLYIIIYDLCIYMTYGLYITVLHNSYELYIIIYIYKLLIYLYDLLSLILLNFLRDYLALLLLIDISDWFQFFSSTMFNVFIPPNVPEYSQCLSVLCTWKATSEIKFVDWIWRMWVYLFISGIQ